MLPEITALYRQTRINDGRIQIPSFRDAARIWLTLIKKKEQRITMELDQVFPSIAYISEVDISTISNCVADIFSESKYVERLTHFKEGVVRSAQRYGITSIESRLENNVTDAAYRAGAANSIRAAVANIEASTKLLIANRSTKMGFESLMTDKVSVLKQNGERHEGIAASVQTNKIFIQRADILIEPGDLVNRRMSNGGQETFEVIDPGFHEKFHSIPAGYQMWVKKLGLPEAKAAIQNISYHITGDNARVNNNSIDKSINVITNSAALDKVAELRQAIETSIPHDQRQSAIEIVDAIEGQFKGGAPSKPVISALLAGLPHVANIASIVSAIQCFL